MNFNQNIDKLQIKIKEENIDCLIINRTDEFLNEYISEDSERLNWATNFSGSAGRALITQENSYLFVDGRYTVQAKEQINEHKITLLHYQEFWNELKKYFNKYRCVALDPKLHSIEDINKIKKLSENKSTKLKFTKTNLIDCLWKDKPQRKYKKIFSHSIQFSGIQAVTKLKNFIQMIKLNNLDGYFLTSLDSIAWLLNFRGDDIDYTPLAFSYLFVSTEQKPTLYLSLENIDTALKEKLDNDITLKPIDQIDYVFKNLKHKTKIGFDYKNTCYYYFNLAKENDVTPCSLENPCLISKAVKNVTELDGSRSAHIRDGVSVTRFLYWLKNHKNIDQETEISAAKKLYDFRHNNELFYSISFDSISAVGKNAALPHYRANKVQSIKLKKNSIYLSDSGGQYYDGTTDITRTIILGKPNDEQKDRFTRVLKGHIKLSSHIFPKGTKGTEIDYLARESLQEIGCDYDHGTGHGIGSFLSVHEGPQRISKKNMFPSIELLPGMIISNEPGYYKEGEYGIRIENILIVKEFNKKLLNFENISWAPIDKDLINLDLLNSDELRWINEYHHSVNQKISNFLNHEERLWLKDVTTSL